MTTNPDRRRVAGPDETSSIRLDHLIEVSDQTSVGEMVDTDEHGDGFPEARTRCWNAGGMGRE